MTRLDDLGLPIHEQTPIGVDAERPPVSVGHNSTLTDEERLARCAAKVNAISSDLEKSIDNAAADAYALGHALNEAHALVRHGHWEDWLQANTKIHPTTARRYMRAATSVKYPTIAGLIDVLQGDGRLTPNSGNNEQPLDITPAEAAKTKRTETKITVKSPAAVAGLPPGKPRPRMSEKEYDRARAVIGNPPDADATDKPERFCSFCGKSQKEVRVIVADTKANICNRCVDACVWTLRDHSVAKEEPLPKTEITVDTGKFAVTMTVDKALNDIAARLSALLDAGMSKKTIVRLFKLDK